MRNKLWLVYVAIASVATLGYFATGHVSYVINVIGLSSPVMIVVALRIWRPEKRLPWIMFSLGMFTFILGDVVSYNYDKFHSIAPALFPFDVDGLTPFPGWADGFYLAVYVFMVAGILLLIHARDPSRDRSSFVDALMLSLGIGVVSWVILISPQAYQQDVPLSVKLTSMAYAQLARGQQRLAVAAAEKALLNSNVVPVRFLAARVLAEAGAIAKARSLAAALVAELPAAPQAYGKIIEGEIALKSGDARSAIKVLSEANALVDTWLGRFDLGRAYFEARAFPQADSEFDQCIARRGEALSLLDEDPTYGYFPTVYYYQGRVREGLLNAGFAASYREYLKIRGASTEDPLLSEVRRRAGS